MYCITVNIDKSSELLNIKCVCFALREILVLLGLEGHLEYLDYRWMFFFYVSIFKLIANCV